MKNEYPNNDNSWMIDSHYKPMWFNAADLLKDTIDEILKKLSTL